MGHPNPAHPDVGLTSSQEAKKMGFGLNQRENLETSYDFLAVCPGKCLNLSGPTALFVEWDY